MTKLTSEFNSKTIKLMLNNFVIEYIFFVCICREVCIFSRIFDIIVPCLFLVQ